MWIAAVQAAEEHPEGAVDAGSILGSDEVEEQPPEHREAKAGTVPAGLQQIIATWSIQAR